MSRTIVVWISSTFLTALTSCSPATDNPEPGCTEGETRCAGTVIETCSGGEFVLREDCADGGYLCRAGEGTDGATCYTPERTCEDGFSACNGTVVEGCAEGQVVSLIDCADDDMVCVEQPGSGMASCIDGEVDCPEGQGRCSDTVLEQCVSGEWQEVRDCSAAGQECEMDGGSAACSGLAWVHFPIEIEDHSMVGSSLVHPIDGISYAYDSERDLFATAYSRDYSDESIAYLWEVDGASGAHRRNVLSGEPFSAAEAFCVGAESWCQFIGFDASSDEFVVVGPSTEHVMHVGTDFSASLGDVTGTHPPDRWIDHTHLYDWTARRLFLYGAVGPGGFSGAVYAFNVDSGAWDRSASDLPEVAGNCIALLPGTNTLYSFGGRETQDGGESTEHLSTFLAIELDGGTAAESDLPAGIGARQAMSCAYDSTREVIYVFGGALVNDHFDDVDNELHNDLWAFAPASGRWTELMPDREGGSISEPDSYGNRAFVGDPEGPNFGKNRGSMAFIESRDRLVLMGEVPVRTHGQIYFLDLAAVDALVE